MFISTFFREYKLGIQVGATTLSFFSIVFLQLMQAKNDAKYIIYLFFVVPVIPACVITCQLVVWDQWEGDLILDPNVISREVAWVALVLAFPMWMMLYNYFDQLFPGDYGKRLPWNYFLKKEE